MSLYTPRPRFATVLRSFGSADGMPFHEALTEQDIQTACDEEGVSFGQGTCGQLVPTKRHSGLPGLRPSSHFTAASAQSSRPRKIRALTRPGRKPAGMKWTILPLTSSAFPSTR